MRRLDLLAATVCLAAMACPVRAADTPSPAPAAPAAAPAARAEPLAVARRLIADKQWAAAIDELRRVNATGNADWNNLMGYSQRKARTPDLAAAGRYYDAALAIDPRHKGALEYAGELALMQGDLARAEQRLAALEGVCRSPCEELDDLKAAVARFKSNGNRYVAR